MTHHDPTADHPRDDMSRQESAAPPSGDVGADILRADVRRLGELVGDILREQQGDRIFATVEYVRTSAIAARGSRQLGVIHATEHPDLLLNWVAQQSSEDLLAVIRAFGIYFHVINLAEQHHRMRMLRIYARSDQPVHESIAAALATLAARGVPAERIRTLLAHLSVHPVLTAHPSEARRRSLLLQLEQVVTLLDQFDDPRATPNDRQVTLDALRLHIVEIYQSAETRMERPSVEEEARTAQYYVATTLYEVAPRLRQALEQAFRATYPQEAPLDAVSPLHIGSWVGGDRDGNPAVSGEVTRDVARLAREAILRRYRDEVQVLGRDLSISLRLVGASPELLDSIQRDRMELDMQPVHQWRDEPYRQKLGLIGERLRRTELGGRGGYSTSDEFATDLAVIAASLRAHHGGRIADGPVRMLQDRLNTLGFSLAELEIRQHAERHAQAVAEVLLHAGHGAYLALDEPGRQEMLSALLSGPPLTRDVRALSADTREILDTFTAIADIQRTFGHDACHTYIISMCRTPSDVLAVLFWRANAASLPGTATTRRAATWTSSPCSRPSTNSRPATPSSTNSWRSRPIAAQSPLGRTVSKSCSATLTVPKRAATSRRPGRPIAPRRSSRAPPKTWALARALPRSRRGDWPWWWPHGSGDPGPRVRGPHSAAKSDRAGRDHLRALQPPRHRGAPPRANAVGAAALSSRGRRARANRGVD